MSSRVRTLARICAALAVALVFETFVVSGSWSQRNRIQRDLHTTRAQNDARQQQADFLREQITALRTRPEVQEYTIRDELGYVKAGEFIVELHE